MPAPKKLEDVVYGAYEFRNTHFFQHHVNLVVNSAYLLILGLENYQKLWG